MRMKRMRMKRKRMRMRMKRMRMRMKRMRMRMDLLGVDLDILLEVVPVQVEHEVMHEAVSVANDDQRKLICQLGFLQEVLDPLRSSWTRGRSVRPP